MSRATAKRVEKLLDIYRTAGDYTIFLMPYWATPEGIDPFSREGLRLRVGVLVSLEAIGGLRSDAVDRIKRDHAEEVVKMDKEYFSHMASLPNASASVLETAERLLGAGEVAKLRASYAASREDRQGDGAKKPHKEKKGQGKADQVQKGDTRKAKRGAK